MKRELKKLGERNYELILRGIQAQGSYDPKEIFYAFEERLYIDEAKDVFDFLEWVNQNTNERAFWHHNYEYRYQEFLKSEDPNYIPEQDEPTKTKIVINMRGGVIQAIASNEENIEIRVLDFDELDGGTPQEYDKIPIFTNDDFEPIKIDTAYKKEWDEAYRSHRKLK